MNITSYIQQCTTQVNTCLNNLLTTRITPSPLTEAMRYSVLTGGKRLRPLLVYAVGETCGATHTALDTTACAVELIHAYSLVHDDLPAMDNAELRRGKLTCHKAYSEATAILVGDALQPLAIECIAGDPAIAESTKISMILCLTKACGALGMVGGQAQDIITTGKPLTLTELTEIYQHKTGALLTACAELSMLVACAHVYPQLLHYAELLGLAFQIQDDILDVEANQETLGKQPGQDLVQGKTTYPSLLGMAAAKQKVQELYQEAMDYLIASTWNTSLLQGLTQYLLQRKF